MKNFEKDQPKLCQTILQNHITSNTEDYKRTIIRTMQTMGVLSDGEDSDSYLENDELLDVPIVNSITNEGDKGNDLHDE